MDGTPFSELKAQVVQTATDPQFVVRGYARELEVWRRQRFELPNDMPSLGTFLRLFGLLTPAKFSD